MDWPKNLVPEKRTRFYSGTVGGEVKCHLPHLRAHAGLQLLLCSSNQLFLSLLLLLLPLQSLFVGSVVSSRRTPLFCREMEAYQFFLIVWITLLSKGGARILRA